MVAKRYEVEFFGGPADGLRICAGTRPRSNVLLPVGRPTWRATSDGVSLAAHRALYRRQSGGDSTGQLRYKFVGIRPRASGGWLRSVQAICRAALRERPMGGPRRNIFQRIKTWLLEPIDYPLRVVSTEAAHAHVATALAKPNLPA